MIEQYLNKPLFYGHEVIKIEIETDEKYKENGDYTISVYDHIRCVFRFFTWVDRITRYGLHWNKSLLNKRVKGVIAFEDLIELKERERYETA